MKGSSPAQRTLALLRRQGWLAAMVERWNPHAGIRQDLFGVADVIAVRADRPGALLVQTTTAGSLAARRKKVQASRAVGTWLAAGNAFELHGWALRGGAWLLKREVVMVGNLKLSGPEPRKLV